MNKKITLLCGIMFFILNMTVFAQNKTVTLHEEQSSIQTILSKIEKQTKYLFVYDKAQIDVKRKITLKVNNKPVSQVLNTLFAGTQVSYSQNGNNIVLTVKKGSKQPTKTVRGVITDANGEPVIGATVTSTATGKGTITDMDGKFTMDVPKNTQLQVSYIGYKKQEIAVGEKNTLKIVLEEENAVLEEVIVVGYGTIKRKEMTSAISHIGAKDLNQMPTMDASMLLQGKVSSVSVSNINAADPDQHGSIQIRGVSSRSAGLGPLIVVDGIPGGDLANINPNDIESMDVLKDGAASAIYGTRGSNGVILINLKKGARDNQVHVTYNGSLTITKAKPWELEPLSADEYRKYRCEQNPGNDYGGNTNWLDAITHTGITHLHSLTFSGGGAQNNYRVTADYRDAEGIIINQKRREYGMRATANLTTKDGLFYFSSTVAPRIIDQKKGRYYNYQVALRNNPTVPVYDETTANGYFHLPLGTSTENIVEDLRVVSRDQTTRRIEWNATAGINLLPLFLPNNQNNLLLKSQVTFAQRHDDEIHGNYSPSTYTWMIQNNRKGEASRAYYKAMTNNFEWVTNFSATFAKHHNVRGMVGYSYNYVVAEGFNAANKDFATDALLYHNLAQGTYAAEAGKTEMGSYKNDSKLISFFGRVNYDWKSRYMMSAAIRHEGSTRFGKNHKWGNFPSISAGWRISDESFMKNVKWIDDLKLRYDFGVTGNQNFDSYKSLSTYSSFGYYSYNNTAFHVWGPGKNTNPDLRWEKAKNQNIGLDFSLFNNRVTGSFNYFIRKQEDLLGDYQTSVPPSLFATIFTNVGTMKNTGFEFDVTVNAVRSKDFNYSFTLVGATNNNKFASFSNDVFKGQKYYSTCQMVSPNNPGYLQRIEEGERVGNFFTWRYAGVSDDGNWLVYNKNNEVIPVGEAKEDDKAITGNGLPKFTASTTHSFKWKNLDASISLRGAFGFQLFNVHEFYFGLQSMQSNLIKEAYGKNAHITTGMNVLTDYFIENGDYVKIDNITLGYTFPLKTRFLDSVRVYSTAQNLYTFTGFSGIDPSNFEVNGLTPGSGGGDYTYYPSAFQFNFGLQINF